MTTKAIQTVTSNDGTRIAAEVTGTGPVVVLLPGGSVDRGANAGLAAVLASDFTVWNVDRRGRGDSGDTLPYAVEREIEDVQALITAAGETAALYGHSSGAVLALRAAAALPSAINKLALYEPPFLIDKAHVTPEGYEARIKEL